jgi:hypothetical protein
MIKSTNQGEIMNKYQIEFLKNVVINYKCKELLETDKRLWKED